MPPWSVSSAGRLAQLRTPASGSPHKDWGVPPGGPGAWVGWAEALVWDLVLRAADSSSPWRRSGTVHQRGVEPDGTRLVTTGAFGSLCVWDAAGKQVFAAPKVEVKLIDPRVIAGRALGVFGSSCVWDVAGKEMFAAAVKDVKRPNSAPPLPWRVLQWAPDSQRLAAATSSEPGQPARGTLKVWDTATGKELLALEGATFANPGPDGTANPLGSWSRDGKLLAVVQNRRLLIADPVAGKTTPLPPGDPPKNASPLFNVLWGPDSREVAATDRQGAIRIWDWAAGRPQLTVPGKPNVPFSWSPDGRWLAQVSAGQGRFAAQAMPTMEVKLWDAATGAERLLPGGPEWQGPSWSGWSHDGRRFAAVGNRGLLHVWDMEDADNPVTVGIPRYQKNDIVVQAWSPTASAWRQGPWTGSSVPRGRGRVARCYDAGPLRRGPLAGLEPGRPQARLRLRGRRGRGLGPGHWQGDRAIPVHGGAGRRRPHRFRGRT